MEKLYLGIGRRDITPEIGARLFGYQDNVYSTCVNDKLCTSAFVFKQGGEYTAVISVSVCLIDTDLCDNIRKKIEEEHNIPYSAIMISTTHTHSGPYTASGAAVGKREDEYCDGILTPAIVGAVGDALKNLDEVTLGYAVGDSFAAINRREPTPDGRIKLGQNKDGVFNPRMTVISFKTTEGKTKGTLIHYGMHGTTCGMNTEISRDWCGVMTDRIEDITDAPCAFLNGPEGDIGPRLANGRTTANLEAMKEFAKIPAKDAENIYGKIKDFESAKIKSYLGTVKIPAKQRLSLAFAKDEYEKYLNERLLSIGLYWKKHYIKVIDSYNNGYEEVSEYKEEQLVIRLDNIVFVATPYELFAEIGMNMQKGYDELIVLPVSNANGSKGYFPTEKEIPLGGYETQSFRTRLIQPFVNDAEKYYVEETKKNINKLV
ncbi:MAG: neutral/alkaline non-lysosomal ceramidase N-terminal domain-containing protein [Clostridia bacterium]|nr:neutral/alkaline non-lysosomal ceramidase N-terminal domain-containing protein [Clostridia bacterium]